MNRTKYIIAAAALGLILCPTTKAREEIKFTSLPEVVRTTVFQHYKITSPDKVVRVVQEPNNIYEITVLTDGGDQEVYVTADGNIVERPSAVVGSIGSDQGSADQGSAEVTVTMDDVRTGGDRYVFVQDQGPDAVYIDHQTNKRVIVKGGAGQGGRGGVRTTEENRTNVQTNETNRTNIRTNEENKDNARTEDKGQPSQGTQHSMSRGEQKDQGNQDQSAVGNGQEQKTRDTSGNPRTEEKNANQNEKNADQRDMKGTQGEKQPHQTNRTPGEQQSQEKSKGKAKPSPSSQ